MDKNSIFLSNWDIKLINLWDWGKTITIVSATDGTAQTEDESKLLNFVFPGAQHAVDLLRCVIFSSGRGATMLPCSLWLHSNKISPVTWQAEKWQECVNRLQGTSLYGGFCFLNLIFSGFVSMCFLFVFPGSCLWSPFNLNHSSFITEEAE